MKTLLFFIFALTFSLGYSQQTRFELFSLDTMDVDTTFPIEMSNDYTWSIHVKWGGMTGTLDGLLKIEHSASDSGLYIEDYVWYGNTETDYIDTVNTAYGNVVFEDTYFSSTKLRVLWDVNSITDGWMDAWITLRRKK